MSIAAFSGIVARTGLFTGTNALMGKWVHDKVTQFFNEFENQGRLSTAIAAITTLTIGTKLIHSSLGNPILRLVIETVHAVALAELMQGEGALGEPIDCFFKKCFSITSDISTPDGTVKISEEEAALTSILQGASVIGSVVAYFLVPANPIVNSTYIAVSCVAIRNGVLACLR